MSPRGVFCRLSCRTDREAIHWIAAISSDGRGRLLRRKTRSYLRNNSRWVRETSTVSDRAPRLRSETVEEDFPCDRKIGFLSNE